MLDSLLDIVMIFGALFIILAPLSIEAMHTPYEYHDIYDITDEGVVIEYDGELHLYDDKVVEGAEYVSGFYWVWEERCPENYHINGSYKYWF